MKFKLTIIAILLAVFGSVLSVETKTVGAQETPVTSPVTTPVSGPVTFAGLKLQGKVTYKILGRWWKSMKQIIPGDDVTVVAKNRETGEKTETQTDTNGDYIFYLPSAKYRVYVAKDEDGWFVPPFKNVNLKSDKDGVNFSGFTWEHKSKHNER